MRSSGQILRKLVWGGLAIVVLGSAAALFGQGFGWALVNWKVRRDFPGIRRTDPKEVAAWLDDKSRPQPVLFDVRTKPEYEVSHLPGARRIDPEAAASAIDLPKDQPIVTYCSVGYRSGALAKKLQEAGFTQVENMAGSIFEWANQGRPLEHEGKPAHKVHPYNATWGKLLKPELRAPE